MLDARISAATNRKYLAYGITLERRPRRRADRHADREQPLGSAPGSGPHRRHARPRRAGGVAPRGRQRRGRPADRLDEPHDRLPARDGQHRAEGVGRRPRRQREPALQERRVRRRVPRHGRLPREHGQGRRRHFRRQPDHDRRAEGRPRPVRQLVQEHARTHPGPRPVAGRTQPAAEVDHEAAGRSGQRRRRRPVVRSRGHRRHDGRHRRRLQLHDHRAARPDREGPLGHRPGVLDRRRHSVGVAEAGRELGPPGDPHRRHGERHHLDGHLDSGRLEERRHLGAGRRAVARQRRTGRRRRAEQHPGDGPHPRPGAGDGQANQAPRRTVAGNRRDRQADRRHRRPHLDPRAERVDSGRHGR